LRHERLTYAVMYRITQGSTQGLSDVETFIEMMNQQDRSPTSPARGLFLPRSEVIVTRAPGRLDVMGGIADYSGSLVLQLPTQEATFAAIQRDPSPTLRIVSLAADDGKRTPVFETPLARLECHGRPVDYETARRDFGSDPKTRWAAYAAGAFLVLMRERAVRFSGGARILIGSTLPEGKGLGSSAAIEVAVMHAIAAAFNLTLPPRDLAILCQTVENLVVGAPCGVMDQMTSVCGEAHRLLALLCQPAELLPAVPIPDDVAFWGLDSGVQHAVRGASYTSVRVAAFMGYRIIADRARLAVTPEDSGVHVRIDDPRWHGYLANISPDEFTKAYEPELPTWMEGGMFLAQYDGTTDPVTRAEGGERYPVRAATAHPIHEHARVREFAELLPRCSGEQRLHRLGELMYQSHASYTACGLGSDATDRIVELVKAVGTGHGLYGAKITGGGSGGTVAVLGRPDALEAVEAVADRYAEHTGHRPHIFSGSSPGAAAFGHLRLAKQA